MNRLLILMIFFIIAQTSFAESLVLPISGDFFVVHDNDYKLNLGSNNPNQYASLHATALSSQCELSTRACLIDKEGDEGKDCHNQSADYGQKLQQVYSNLPSITQRVLCSVRKFFIYEQLSGIGYASVVYRRGRHEANIIGISKNAMNGQSDISEIFTAKDQKQFQIAQNGTQSSQHLKHEISLAVSNPALSYVLIHEAAHILDFNIGMTMDFNCIREGRFDCPIQQSGFTEGRWRGVSTKERRAQFSGHQHFCYYECLQPLLTTLDGVVSLYQSFIESTFVTPYATTFAFEDFAENTTFYLLTTEQRFQFKYELNLNGQTYDLVQRYLQDQFASLRSFLSLVYSPYSQR